MAELAPADGPVIGEFCSLVRRFACASGAMGATGPSGPLAAAKWLAGMLPYLGDMRKYARISVQQYAARFGDPFLRRAFAVPFDLPDFAMLGMLFSLAWMHLQDAGYPIGGSLQFSEAIERRYCDLGGDIHYRSPVEKVLVEPGPDGAVRAVGVRLRSGAEYRAGTIISAADGHATIFDMLDGRFLDDKVRGYYANLSIFQPIVQVSLGLARDLSAEPHSLTYALDRPIEVSGRRRDLLGVRHYGFDPTLAPAGKSVAVVNFESEHAYWRGLRDEDSERYEAEKQRVAEAVIDRLAARFPGLAAQVEAVDVATLLTTERYTGNWQGSIEGWSITTKTAPMLFGRGMAKTLPGLDGFCMAGQWVEPGGGVPTAAASGRRTIQNLCKRDGKKFVSSEPR